jgi:hypothetical protein
MVPPESIARSVIREPLLLEKAWALPSAATYGGELDSQTNGSTCGPASLANVFRSLHRSARDENAVLEGSGLCRFGFCFMGLTLDELAGLARREADVDVELLRDLDAEELRAHLRRSNDPANRYIVNFNRKPIFGAGGGHHSPIGGYLEDEDLVFVLDVNADFGPWLIERTRLHRAIDGVDSQSGQKRGLLWITTGATEGT